MFRTAPQSRSAARRPAGRARAVLAAGAVAALVGLGAATPALAADTTDPNDRYTAEEVHTFLEAFYGEHGPGDFARTYGISPFLKDKVDHSEGFDLLLCAQNTPVSIDIGPVTTAQSAGVGWATVTTHWGDGNATSAFRAYVSLDAEYTLQLRDVDCAPSD